EFQNVHVKELYRMAGKLGLNPSAITAAVRASTYAGSSTAAVVTPEVTTPEDTSDSDDDGDVIAADAGASEDTSEDTIDTTVSDAVENEVRAIRDAVTQRGFSALDERLRELVSEARKPPVTVYIDRTPALASDGSPVIVSKPTNEVVTWRKAFG